MPNQPEKLAQTASNTTPKTMSKAALKVALITGAAKRLGKQVAITLHKQHYNVVIHCHHSVGEANALAESLNEIRAESAKVVVGNITDDKALSDICRDTMACFNRLDLLVNNASSFYPTDDAKPDTKAWDNLTGTNMKAPYLLSCLLAPYLSKNQGNIINLVDIHADRPLKSHTVYCMAKAGLKMMIKSLACELAPLVRVNGISPGAILWPEQPLTQGHKTSIMNQIALQRLGTAQDIADTVIFLANAPYITGQTITVDGGRSLLGANIA
jgi:pteridine reductase